MTPAVTARLVLLAVVLHGITLALLTTAVNLEAIEGAADDLTALAVAHDEDIALGAVLDIVLDGALESSDTLVDGLAVQTGAGVNRRVLDSLKVGVSTSLLDHSLSGGSHARWKLVVTRVVVESLLAWVGTADGVDDGTIGALDATLLKLHWAGQGGGCQGRENSDLLEVHCCV